MALSANNPLTFIRGEQSEYPVYQAVKIYEGAMLGYISGYARGLVAGDPFLGHSMEYIDNTDGSSGDLKVTRIRGRYRLESTISGVAITDVGKTVFASADGTLTLTAGSNSRVGVVDRYVTTDTCIVEFQTNEIESITSDLTALLSNLATVTGSSDFTSLQSDVVTLKSDNVVNKSNIVAIQSDRTWGQSDVATLKSDNVVNKSNVVALQSDRTWLSSDNVSHKSDIVVFKANRTKELKAISDAKVAFDAGDYVNVSDIKVSFGEVIKAFSDALI
jgi:hypothetical protein